MPRCVSKATIAPRWSGCCAIARARPSRWSASSWSWVKILGLVRAHVLRVPAIVRTVDDADIDRLKAAGATEVVPEAAEGSLMLRLGGHALALVGVRMKRVIRITRDARDARYSLLRGYFYGAEDDTVEELEQARLQSVTLPEASRRLGQTLENQALHAVGISVVPVRRASGGAIGPEPQHVLGPDDTLLLSGLPQPLALAEEKLLRG